MSEILKITIGVRPSARMFRVSSLYGILVDEVLAARGKGVLGDEYYKGITKNEDQTIVRLLNEDEGNFLQIDHDNVTFTKDYYSDDEQFNWNNCFKEYCYIWELINKTLKVTNIRRIGIVCELKFDAEKGNPSQVLLNNLTKMPKLAHPAKAKIVFEDRKPTIEGLAPDIKKSDFINVIHEIYDGELDTEHPDDKFIYSTLDTQRYYSPLLKSDVPKEIEKLYKKFKSEKCKFTTFMDSMGISSNG